MPKDKTWPGTHFSVASAWPLENLQLFTVEFESEPFVQRPCVVVDHLSVHEHRRTAFADRPTERVGDELCAYSSSTNFGVDTEALQERRSPGPTSDCVSDDSPVDGGDPVPMHGGGLACRRQPVPIELPELVERFGIDLEHASSIASAARPHRSDIVMFGSFSQRMAQHVKRLPFDEAGFDEAILFDRGHRAGHHWTFNTRGQVVDKLSDLIHTKPSMRDDLRTKRRVLPDDDPNTAHGAREAFEQHDAEVTCLPLASPGVDQMLPDVLSEVQSLTTAFSDAGYSLYLVGGIVRDIHLGVPIADLDFDLTTEARPEKIRELIAPLSDAVWSQGEKFGTIGCRIDGRPYEITTHRAESYSDESRKPEVVFGDDIEVDLSRRDFTLNAMAIDTTHGTLIDPFDGLAALRDRSLVTPIEPEISFSDDPLRILRAARFVARLDLTVADPVRAAAVALIDRMSIVSEERIRDEFDKLLAAPLPSKGLRFLSAVGAWPHVVSTIDSNDVLEMGADLDRARIDRDLRRLVVFSRTASRDRQSQLERLRYSNSESRAMRLVLAGFDLVAHGGQEFEASTVRRLVDRVGYESMPLLLELVEVRQVSDRGLGALFADLDERENLASLGPELTGEDIMDLLGIVPGPEVGAALSVLQERRFEEGPLDRSSEVAFLLEKYRRRR